MPSDNSQCKIADILDRYEAQIKQEAMYVERQAKTGGNDENTPYYRGVSYFSSIITSTILIVPRTLVKLSSTSIAHEALWI